MHKQNVRELGLFDKSSVIGAEYLANTGGICYNEHNHRCVLADAWADSVFVTAVPCADSGKELP